MTNILLLPPNDDRFGTVDPARNLIYPARDVFGNPIPVRSAMQVVWAIPGETFVCFPHAVNVDEYTVGIEGYVPRDGYAHLSDGGYPLPRDVAEVLSQAAEANSVLPMRTFDMPSLVSEAEMEAVRAQIDAAVLKYTNDRTLPGLTIDSTPDDQDRDTEDADDVSLLHEMTKAQLIDLAAARGLSLSDRLTKQALIDALIDHA